MRFLKKPWGRFQDIDRVKYKPEDSLNGFTEGNFQFSSEHTSVLGTDNAAFTLFPYPKRGFSSDLAINDFPVRFRTEKKIQTEQDVTSQKLTNEMNNLIARVQELEDALDNPSNVWKDLRDAWRRAEKEDDPLMAEIVRQANELVPHIKDLEKKIRRILRRDTEKIQLDRVQEMDRASMRWLSKQPGTTLAQRAGSSQRILAIVRKENFDTIENKVLRSYLILAEKVTKDWLDDNKRAISTKRYQSVEKLRKISRNFARYLKSLGVGEATADVTPNYVLMQDKNYNKVYDAWIRLLRRESILDDLWAWQGEIWTDFCALAIVLSLNDLNEAELIAQSPIVWQNSPDNGKWFEQHQPLAIFWLKESGRIVEVFSRKESDVSLRARAAISLRVTEQSGNEVPRWFLVWTPHNLFPSNFKDDVDSACRFISPLPTAQYNVRRGIILMPSHGESRFEFAVSGNKRVDLVAFDAFGLSLAKGMKKIGSILKSEAVDL
jgi:hypothetical protein